MLFRHEQNCNSGTYRFGMAMTGPCGDKEEGRDTEGVIKTASSFLKILGGDAADVEGGGAHEHQHREDGGQPEVDHREEQGADDAAGAAERGDGVNFNE